MARRSSHHELFEEDESELNLTPYLDIITTLVIFMIFTFQVIIEARLIEVLAPQTTSDGASGQSDTPPLVYVLVLGDDEIRIRDNAAPPTDMSIPKVNGKYDLTRLIAELTSFKNGAKERGVTIGDNITVTGKYDLPYRDFVAVMDAVRTDSQGGVLFPAVELAQSYDPGAAAAPAGETP